jgi:C4-dicarboxylate-specific signal transduction histidine kinase
MNISITYKILIGFIVVSFLGMLSNLFALIKFGNIELSTREISEIQEVVLVVNAMEENLKVERQSIQDYYEIQDSTVYNMFVRTTQAFNEQVAAFRFKAYWADDPLRTTLNKVIVAQNDLVSKFNSVVFAPAALSRTSVHKEITVLAIRMDRGIYELAGLLRQRVDDRLQQVNTTGRTFNKMILFLLFLTGCVSILFCGWIARSFVGPFRKLLWNIRLIGQGQFDQTVDIASTDEEIQALIDAFQTMQKQLKKYRDNLIETERLNAVSLLATSVSHEVNNPLMIISGTAEYIRTVKSSADEEIKEKMTSIIDEVQRISSITRKLTRIKQIILEDYTLKDTAQFKAAGLMDIESSSKTDGIAS